MKDGKKKYTFEDWKKGKIPPPPESENMPDSQWVWYWHITDPSRINEDERDRIIEEKRKAYFQAVEQNLFHQKKDFKRNCANAPKEEIEDILNLEIKAIKDSMPDSLLLRIKKGHDDSKALNPYQYQYIKRSISENLYCHVARKPNNKCKLFNSIVKYRFMKWLEKRLQEIQSQNMNCSQDKFEVYRQILNTPEGITAGKMAFFRKVKSDGSYRNKPQAFDEADEIHKELKGKSFYKNIGSFEARESQFFKERDDAQETLKKILKPFK